MTAWIGGDYSPADFDQAKAATAARRAAKAGQLGLFATGTPTRAAKPAPVPARLPGEVDLFADVTESPSSRGHVPDPDPEQGAFDVCLHCRQPIVQHWEIRETWVTMTGGNAECYGRK